LLDKRAIHLGGGGTHRLGLHDAILIKNNHLALLDSDEEKAVVTALERAWTRKEDAAFIEVEVRSEAETRAARIPTTPTFRDVPDTVNVSLTELSPETSSCAPTHASI
jgi:nicotinate-nucleotide pyrophosphorylase